MRKLVAVLLAVALVQFVGVATSAAGIVGGTVGTCGKDSGKAAFSPALPRFGNNKKVRSKLTATETWTGCTGGGVTSAKVTLSAIPGWFLSAAPLNCTYFFTPHMMGPIGGTETVTWNNGETSTAGISAFGERGKNHSWTLVITGLITAGLFEATYTTEYMTITSIPPGGCTKHGLGRMTLNNIKSIGY